ncbi:MAG: hypothetical protein ABSF35_10740 [Polyangia bacterium]|jgi:hypothetical protein
MAKTMNITPANIELCESAKAELIERLEELARMTRRYPVECVFGEFRRVFATKADIQKLIDELAEEISDYYRRAA